jgi:hypothetical protein
MFGKPAIGNNQQRWDSVTFTSDCPPTRQPLWQAQRILDRDEITAADDVIFGRALLEGLASINDSDRRCASGAAVQWDNEIRALPRAISALFWIRKRRFSGSSSMNRRRSSCFGSQLSTRRRPSFLEERCAACPEPSMEIARTRWWVDRPKHDRRVSVRQCISLPNRQM